MNELTQGFNDTLPKLIDRAAGTLTAAKTSAEVLEARDMARVAYDAAKSAGRMARGKQAYDEVIGAVYRAQADALLIEARAKVRLADEYDAAQERGEVATVGNPSIVGGSNDRATAADLGLRRDEIHEARKIRDAEAAEPGKVAETLKKLVDSGEEPTKAKLRRAIEYEPPAAVPPPEPTPDPYGYAKLTDAALLDLANGLRADLDEEKAKRKAAEAEVKALKSRIADLTASDTGKTIARMQKTIEHKASELFREGEKLAAEKRKNYALNKRVEELQQMGIAL